MPLLPSSGPNGLFHPFPDKASSRSGSGVPKLSPNRNIAAAKASGEAAADFSQFLDANVGDSSSETKTSPAQTSGQLPSSDGALLNQIEFDSQTAWPTPPGIPAPAGDVPDTAVSVPGQGTRADSAKVRMLAGAIEWALPPIATAKAKDDAAKPAPTAGTQKEEAPPAIPAQNDASASVVPISVSVPVALLLAKPALASDAPSITKPAANPATSSAPQISVALDNSKPVSGSETLAFQAHLLPEPWNSAHALDAPAAGPQASAPRPAIASAPAVSLNPTPAQGVSQDTGSSRGTNGKTSSFGDGSPAQGSTGTPAASAPAVTAPDSGVAFSGAPQFQGKSVDDKGTRSSSDSSARADNIVSLPAPSADIKAPDRFSSAQSLSSTQAMPMQKQDAPPSPQAKTYITFRLQGQSGETVSVRVSDRAGDIQIAVRSTDPATAATLRHDLPTLQSGLERAGWHMEAAAASMPPAAAIHQPGRGDGSSSDQPRQSAQSRAEDYSQGGRRRSSPNDQWMDVMNTNA